MHMVIVKKPPPLTWAIHLPPLLVYLYPRLWMCVTARTIAITSPPIITMDDAEPAVDMIISNEEAGEGPCTAPETPTTTTTTTTPTATERSSCSYLTSTSDTTLLPLLSLSPLYHGGNSILEPTKDKRPHHQPSPGCPPPSRSGCPCQDCISLLIAYHPSSPLEESQDTGQELLPLSS